MASSKHSSVNGKGALDGAYKLFMKSSPVYVTTVLIAALVVEGVYGSATNYIWETNNRGVRCTACRSIQSSRSRVMPHSGGADMSIAVLVLLNSS
jgi:hypothetical protein